MAFYIVMILSAAAQLLPVVLAHTVLPTTMDQSRKVTNLCHRTTTNSPVVLFAKTL